MSDGEVTWAKKEGEAKEASNTHVVKQSQEVCVLFFSASHGLQPLPPHLLEQCTSPPSGQMPFYSTSHCAEALTRPIFIP